MAFNPAPVDSRRGAALPFLGWFAMAAAVYMAVKIVRPGVPAASGNRPRHDSGREVSNSKSLRYLGAYLFMVFCGVWAPWHGIATGQLSVLGMGIMVDGTLIASIPLVYSQAKSLLRRHKD
jgi:hypothetical protein